MKLGVSYNNCFYPRPWHSPGKATGVGCHFLLQCTLWVLPGLLKLTGHRPDWFQGETCSSLRETVHRVVATPRWGRVRDEGLDGEQSCPSGGQPPCPQLWPFARHLCRCCEHTGAGQPPPCSRGSERLCCGAPVSPGLPRVCRTCSQESESRGPGASTPSTITSMQSQGQPLSSLDSAWSLGGQQACPGARGAGQSAGLTAS